MTFPAGAKIRADEINEAFGLLAMAVNDTAVTNSTTAVSAAGLVLPLEADTQYVLDGYIAYSAGAAGDMQIRLHEPIGGWAGHWNFFGLQPGAINSVGELNAVTIGGFGSLLLLAGSDAFGGTLAARLLGFVATDENAGNLTVQFAQGASSGTPTVIRAGSWIRARKAS